MLQSDVVPVVVVLEGQHVHPLVALLAHHRKPGTRGALAEEEPHPGPEVLGEGDQVMGLCVVGEGPVLLRGEVPRVPQANSRQLQLWVPHIVQVLAYGQEVVA